MKQAWNLHKEQFGPLLEYITDDDITDIDWNGDSLWIRKVNQKKQKINNPEITKDFIKSFSYYVQNHESKPFNGSNNVLCSDTETMRITLLHDSMAASGLTMSIRKSLPRLRYTPESAIKDKLCSKAVMNLLMNCILAHRNMIFCGKPGDGKTEAAKFFSSFIRNNEKVVTIEEVREWHYKKINPQKDCVEIKVKNDEEYEMAIKTALRLNPDWLMISEVRSREVTYLMEALSTGVKGISTIHTDDVRKIAERIVNMSDSKKDPKQIKDNVFMFLNVGVLIAQESDDEIHTHREIKQIAFYVHDYDTGKNKSILVVDDGVLYPDRIPEDIQKIIKKEANTDNIFKCKLLDERR